MFNGKSAQRRDLGRFLVVEKNYQFTLHTP
jgi:hypothetical protein